MPKIGQPPKAPQWPWGGPREVRDRLVDRSQLERKNVKKKGDPRNPSLPSTALLDFIGPAHSAEELRLPFPPVPDGHQADLDGFLDRGPMSEVAARFTEEEHEAMLLRLGNLSVAPERIERLKVLLSHESSMLELVAKVSDDMAEIEQRRREETVDDGF